MEKRKEISTFRERKEVCQKIFSLVKEGKTKAEIFDILSEEYCSLHDLSKIIDRFPQIAQLSKFSPFNRISLVLMLIFSIVVSAFFTYRLVNICLSGHTLPQKAVMLLIFIPFYSGIICFLYWVIKQVKLMNGYVYLGACVFSLLQTAHNILSLFWGPRGMKLWIITCIFLFVFLFTSYVLYKFFPHLIRRSKKFKYKQYLSG